jgi:hypothetical protein
LVNILLYQTGWFACVLGAAHDHPWLGALGGGVLTAIHVALVCEPRRELALLLCFGVVGAALDSMHSCSGVLTFASGYVVGCLAPPWIIVLWIQFATVFRYSLRWLLGRYWLAALLGGLGGPLAFFVGERLGAVTFLPRAWVSLVVIGIVWASALPLLVWRAGPPLTGALAGKYRWLG